MSEPVLPIVRARQHEQHLEVSFDRGYTSFDVAAVKAIPGRKWLADHRIWLLPYTPRVLRALRRSFGARLVLQTSSPAADGGSTARPTPSHPGQPTPRRIPADDARSTSRRIPAEEARSTARQVPADEARSTSHQGPADEARSTSRRSPADEARSTSRRIPADEARSTSHQRRDDQVAVSPPSGANHVRPQPDPAAGGEGGARHRDSHAAEVRRARAQDESERIVEAMRQEFRVRDYSNKTVFAYVSWVQRFLRFCADRVDSADALTAAHAHRFLEHLADTERLAARSRNQAASALSFMFREILGRDEMTGVARAKGPTRLPVVLSHREVLCVLRELKGKYFLIGVLLYSAGLRLEECLRLRVKDIDFELRQILVRDGKGRKDRYVPLARRAVDLLRAQLQRVAELHEKDRAATAHGGWAPLPGAMHRKDPSAGFALGWQWIFPAQGLTPDPATDRQCRWPLHTTAVQREIKHAVRRSGITKRATCHTLRHSFATEALRGGCDIRTLQHVMGHKDIRTTTIYLHVVEQTGLFMRSPLDRPDDPEDTDSEPIGKPWAWSEQHWDLAARQWEPAPRERASAKRRRADAAAARSPGHEQAQAQHPHKGASAPPKRSGQGPLPGPGSRPDV